jgi:hypothetical protein
MYIHTFRYYSLLIAEKVDQRSISTSTRSNSGFTGEVLEIASQDF